MIVLLRKIVQAHNSVLKYNWDYLPYIGNQISGLTIGVVGYGRLGKIFCKQLNGFGSKILVNDPYVKNCPYNNISLSDLISKVNVLVLHVHVNDKTRKFINNKMIKKMKKGAIIINTSRGELVDENDILKNIKSGHLGGYGTDVLADEFENIKKSPLIKYANKFPIVITPHVGGMTIEGQTKAFMFAIKKFNKLKLT